MSSAALLRPGVALGIYPQRDDVRENWLDRALASTSGFARKHMPAGGSRHQRFAAQVDAQAVGLETASEMELKRMVRDLRRRLYSEGLADELIAHSFAIIRELASRRLKMRHYDVQLYGGYVMLQGKIAEMETGEGKTMTATLPAATAA